jgi:hypothetical protein
MIAILCPTRGRPEQCRRMMRSASGAAIYLGLSTEEDQRQLIFSCNYISVFPDILPTAQKWNYLAKFAMDNQDNKLFMLGADDMYFATEGWDKALIDHYNSLENKIHVYALQDSRDENGTPHVIVTREYIEAMGYFVPPIFLHWYIDTWTVEIAKANNCFTHFHEYSLVHDKPSDHGKADETHNRIRSWGWQDRDKYVNDTCQHILEIEKRKLGVEIYKVPLNGLVDLSSGTEGIIEFTNGDKYWCPMVHLDKDENAYSIRIEHGCYGLYTRNGTPKGEESKRIISKFTPCTYGDKGNLKVDIGP